MIELLRLIVDHLENREHNPITKARISAIVFKKSRSYIYNLVNNGGSPELLSYVTEKIITELCYRDELELFLQKLAHQVKESKVQEHLLEETLLKKNNVISLYEKRLSALDTDYKMLDLAYNRVYESESQKREKVKELEHRITILNKQVDEIEQKLAEKNLLTNKLKAINDDLVAKNNSFSLSFESQCKAGVAIGKELDALSLKYDRLKLIMGYVILFSFAMLASSIFAWNFG